MNKIDKKENWFKKFRREMTWLTRKEMQKDREDAILNLNNRIATHSVAVDLFEKEFPQYFKNKESKYQWGERELTYYDIPIKKTKKYERTYIINGEPVEFFFTLKKTSPKQPKGGTLGDMNSKDGLLGV